VAEMSETQGTEPRPLDGLLGGRLRIDLYLAIFAGLVLLTILTRFADLGTRVMSHDETTHVYFSWQLEQGRGYAHDPLSHGPLQFHLLALSYFLFGDSDASARFPVAVAGVMAVLMIWPLQRWIGRQSALVTAALMFASPFMLYYARYARNEAYVVVEALLMFWAVFSYLERRRASSLYWLAAALSLHFVTKETSFIYAAQLLILLAVLFLIEAIRKPWPNPIRRTVFLLGIVGAVIAGGTALVVFLRDRTLAGDAATMSASLPVLIGVLLALAAAVLAAVMFVQSFGRRVQTEFPALDLFIVTGTLTATQLGAFPSAALGWDPLAYSDFSEWGRTLAMVVVVVVLAAAVGLLWNWRRWIIAAGIFAAIYVPLYTTLFTNPQGLATGLVGSLGYWLVQQGVQRGTQPLYYYLLIEIPLYEYLVAIGGLVAAGMGISSLIREYRWPGLRQGGFRDLRTWALLTLGVMIVAWGARALGYLPAEIPAYQYLVVIGALVAAGIGIAYGIRRWGQQPPKPEEGPAAYDIPSLYPLVFGYWSVTALVLYTFAGERMPWLTVHIALPLIMLSGWAFGRFLNRVAWGRFREVRTWALLALVTLTILSLARFFGYLLGSPPPFGGTDLEHLRSTNGAITTLVVALVAGFAVVRLAMDWSVREVARLAGVAVLSGLYVLTLRASMRASFVNYDDATEYLVYAHSAGGPKLALAQIEELSRRTTGGLDIDLGYDNESTYPFWWYLRNYPKAHFFGEAPSRDIVSYPVVLAGQGNWDKVEAILRDRYYAFEYNRVWWPMQDYFGLTVERIRNALTSPEWRRALWDVWFHRDYTRYGEVAALDMSLRNWSPAEKLKLYVRKDVATQVWNYGIAPAVLEPVSLIDPYAEKTIVLPADASVGASGPEEGQFSTPRGIAVAPDGTLYVADTTNHRIQHLAADGTPLQAWGSFANIDPGPAPGGTFNEPWGVAVAGDGTVYVADTWNHRVQRFSPTGRFLGMWGTFGQAESQTALWGPRAVAVDAADRVYVADTGNKRIVVFDEQGNPLGQIGEPGGGPLGGQLAEPVGVAIGRNGLVYVADTWNSRIQVFEETEPNIWQPIADWQLDAWLTDSLDNKPYLDVNDSGRICASDPDGFRVLCFTDTGEFLVGWGSPGADVTQLGLPVGVAFDSACGLWVSDASNDRLMHFTLPGCS